MIEEQKAARDLYLERIQANDEADATVYPQINMTKPEAQDAFFVLTNHLLKVEYDKNNVYFSEEDFIKKKAKSIPSYERWGWLFKGLGGFAMYPVIISFAFSPYSVRGRQMAIAGLMLACYAVYELKRPSDVSENWAIDMFNELHMDERLVKWLKVPNRYTIHQAIGLLKSLWQNYFQFCLGISKLIDENPD